MAGGGGYSPGKQRVFVAVQSRIREIICAPRGSKQVVAKSIIALARRFCFYVLFCICVLCYFVSVVLLFCFIIFVCLLKHIKNKV